MYRALAVAHILLAILIVPLTLTIPILTALFLIGPIWGIKLGLRMWRREPGLARTIRRTHFAFLVIDGLLIWWGFAMLRAADESAKRGGGLLGGIGLYPIGIGIVLALFSVVTLVTTMGQDGPST
jgi:hypothetical protein